MMPLAVKDSKAAMLSAQIKGIVNASPATAKLRLTGENFASAGGGCPTVEVPTVNAHHGTNRETTISSKVAEPPATPIQLIS